MKKSYTVIIILILMLLVIENSSAGNAHHGKGKFLQFFDTNNDDIVTLDELNDASKKRFMKMDKDNNGYATGVEFRQYVGQRRLEHRKQKFTLIDENNDGQVTQEEYLLYKKRRSEQKYSTMDVNKDSVVSMEEFTNHKGKHKHKKNRHGTRGHSGHTGMRFFSKLDINDDGVITLEESITSWTDWFNRIDENSDQLVTDSEVKQYRSNKHKQ